MFSSNPNICHLPMILKGFSVKIKLWRKNDHSHLSQIISKLTIMPKHSQYIHFCFFLPYCAALCTSFLFVALLQKIEMLLTLDKQHFPLATLDFPLHVLQFLKEFLPPVQGQLKRCCQLKKLCFAFIFRFFPNSTVNLHLLWNSLKTYK